MSTDIANMPRSWDDCGCGSKVGWLRYFPVPQWCFRSDCCLHDALYRQGVTPTDRKHADKLFYALMQERVRLGKPWYQRPGHYALAWIYYRMVRMCGKAAFVHKEKAA